MAAPGDYLFVQGYFVHKDVEKQRIWPSTCLLNIVFVFWG